LELRRDENPDRSQQNGKKMKRSKNLRENYKDMVLCGGTFHTTSAHLETIMKCCRTPRRANNGDTHSGVSKEKTKL
jgi:hypothetical protein